MLFRSLGNGSPGTSSPQDLLLPSTIKPNLLYLGGHWNFTPEYAETQNGESQIVFKYRAKNVYFVASSDKGINIQILKDGKPLGNSAGDDVARDGSGTALIKDERLYKLIQDSDYGEHTITIIIKKSGLRAYTFTFG